ncbi:MAG TPA: hypothetical protein VIU64_04315 [Polyangia bacterium]
MHGLLAALLFAVDGVAARAGGAAAAPCPTASQIDVELKRLGESATLRPLGASDVTVEGESMRIVLRDPAGAELGVREVVAPSGCAERASLAAVLLVAWAKTWNETALEPSAPPVAATPHRDRDVELGIAAGATKDGDAWAPAASVSAIVQIHRAVGAVMMAEVAGPRQVQVGPGEATYAVSRLGGGPALRLRSGQVWTDVALLPHLTRLSLEGKGLMPGRAATVWGASIQGRGRVGLRWGRLGTFVSLAVDRTLVQEKLTLDDTNDSRRLSPWDVRAELGVSWVFGRSG